jgi:antitoxin component YwqK of YwqJK toxin-antitoxin module
MKKTILPFLLLLLFSFTLAGQEVILKKGLYRDRKTGKPFSGIYREKNQDNLMIAETSITDGLLDGFSTIYYASGVKKEVREYKAGQKDGTWTAWNEEGIKTAEARFKNGKKNGFWFIWDDQGVKRYEMYYENGEKKGTWIIRDEKGNIISQEELK